MFGMFPFGAGYFGDGPGSLGEIAAAADIIQLEFTFRRSVDLELIFEMDVVPLAFTFSRSVDVEMTTQTRLDLELTIKRMITFDVER